MIALGRAIQGLILFSSAFGALFLLQVFPVLPPEAFDIVTFGWLLFVVDSVLTFLRPRVSYYLGVVLAILALGATFSQPQHFQLIASGNLPATATIVIGSAAEVLLVALGVYFILATRKNDPWAWPGNSGATDKEDGPGEIG